MLARYPILVAIAASQLCSAAVAEPTKLGPLPVSLMIVDQQISTSVSVEVDVRSLVNEFKLSLKGTLVASGGDVTEVLRSTINASLPYTTSAYTCRITLRRLRSVDVKSAREGTIIIFGRIAVEGEGIFCPVATADASFSFELRLAASQNRITISMPSMPTFELTVFQSKKNFGDTLLPKVQDQLQKLSYQLPQVEGTKVRLKGVWLSKVGKTLQLKSEADITIASSRATDLASDMSILQTPLVLKLPARLE